MRSPWIPRAMRVAPRLDPAIRPGPPRTQVRPADQPLLPQGPPRQLRQARPDPLARPDEHRRGDPAGLGGRLLGREPAPGTAPVGPLPAGRRHHRPPDLRRAGVCAGALVSRAGCRGRPGRAARPVLPRGGRPARRRGRRRRGRAVWPEVLRDVEAGTLRALYRGSYRRPYRDDPPPRRDLLPRRGFLTTTSLIATRGCHNRCGFCYLATDGLAMPYQVRDVEQVVAEFRADGQPYGVFVDNNLGSRPDYLRSLCHALRPLEVIWSAAVTIDVTDDPSLVRAMALAGCTGVFVGFESLADANLSDARKKTPERGGLRAAGGDAARPRHPGQRQLRPGLRPRPPGCLRGDGRLDRGGAAGVRHVPHPDALPGHAAVPADGVRGAAPAQGLVAVRHGARRLPPPAHDAGGAIRGLRLVLRAAVLARLDLAAATRRLACGAAVPGDVVPLQAVEPALAPADPAPADRSRVASAGRVDAAAAPAIPAATGGPDRPGECPMAGAVVSAGV